MSDSREHKNVEKAVDDESSRTETEEPMLLDVAPERAIQRAPDHEQRMLQAGASG